MRKRLTAIADMLGSVPTVADIGCDHGKLSVYLCRLGHSVIATDASEKSAEKAKKAAQRANVSLDVRIGDGLHILSPHEAQACVIAGLGGREILRILLEAEGVSRAFARIVLQPMQRQGELREGLIRNGFAILDESLVLDEGRIFELLLVRSGEPETFPVHWPEGFYELGWQPVLRQNPHVPALVARRKREIEARLREASRGAENEAGELLARRLAAYSEIETLYETLKMRG